MAGAGVTGFINHGGIAVGTSSHQAGGVICPQLILLGAQKIQVLPRKDAGGVTIRKRRLHRVIANRLQRSQTNFALAGLQNLLPRPVALNLGRGGVDAHQLKRNAKSRAVGKTDFKHAGLAVNRYVLRCGRTRL